MKDDEREYRIKSLMSAEFGGKVTLKNVHKNKLEVKL